MLCVVLWGLYVLLLLELNSHLGEEVINFHVQCAENIK